MRQFQIYIILTGAVVTLVWGAGQWIGVWRR